MLYFFAERIDDDDGGDVQVYMALSNCRDTPGLGLRLRYRLEIFGYASDDRCASGAAPSLTVGRRSVVVRAVAAAAERCSSTAWSVRRLADAFVFRCEQCKNLAGLAVVLSLSAVWTSLQT